MPVTTGSQQVASASAFIALGDHAAKCFMRLFAAHHLQQHLAFTITRRCDLRSSCCRTCRAANVPQVNSSHRQRNLTISSCYHMQLRLRRLTRSIQEVCFENGARGAIEHLASRSSIPHPKRGACWLPFSHSPKTRGGGGGVSRLRFPPGPHLRSSRFSRHPRLRQEVCEKIVI